uniref:Uncharacterized protein n=1 Tax=Lactuca sativa TaxID=4236 RepID=A0A9R1W3P1_LACSA|nr:hypothetical protein LSAT_V11C300112000 [Lactuca sativa]
MDSASHMKMVIEIGELDEQLGESDEDHHRNRRVEEQLGESDGFSLGYAYVVEPASSDPIVGVCFSNRHLQVWCWYFAGNSLSPRAYNFQFIVSGAYRVRYVLQKTETEDRGGPCVVANNKADGKEKESSFVNEIQNFIDGRYICPHEAAWRILDFHIHHRHQPVQILSVHTENTQHIMFNEESTIQSVLSNRNSSRTTLLAWYERNVIDASGHDVTYVDYPKYYKWDAPSKSWERRADDSSKMVGRVVFVHPSSGELFYLRMLLSHQKGCKSFEDLCTVSNIVHPTYRSLSMHYE